MTHNEAIMPRVWRRSKGNRRCGSCGASIPKDTPELAIQPDGAPLTRDLVRCPTCAGEAVPAALAPPVLPALTPLPLPAFLRTRPRRALPSKTGQTLPFDWRKRASGDEDVA
jgi:hypothetical protein